MQMIKTYVITFLVFMSIDLVWLGFVAKKLYRSQIGFIMKTHVNWVAAILFYLLYIVGLLVFALNPALEKNSWQHALFLGMFFGLITYATYDLTNLATLKDWPLAITIIDLAWGTTLGGLTTLLSYLIVKRIS
ncbi:DUF2177 family protein [Vallitalea pronyensis]|uniref:DUF2177 family protein n=1 Tax=Vallitalea pronyensis TaxID=1348613 RepID=A0A8J8MMI7_9FIRM|nr:DUF2177 family protein [Vallitalea pronyensis]QUI24420.1 DUF2177 family protein [Vallitalea pronyensis]